MGASEDVGKTAIQLKQSALESATEAEQKAIQIALQAAEDATNQTLQVKDQAFISASDMASESQMQAEQRLRSNAEGLLTNEVTQNAQLTAADL